MSRRRPRVAGNGNRKTSNDKHVHDKGSAERVRLGSRLLRTIPFLHEQITIDLPSDLALLDSVLELIGSRLLELGILTTEDCEVLVALDEAIVNAIKHGNNGDPSKKVKIVAAINQDGASFTITDEGCGFVEADVPDPTNPGRLLEPSGRGLLLIRHIMDSVEFNACGNEVRMFKRSVRKTSS